MGSRVARAIFACGLPFNAVWSPYLQNMLRAINEAPRGYKGPNFEKVHPTLLWNEILIIECWNRFIPVGTAMVSLLSNGWTDMANNPLINIIVCLFHALTS
jgi:hypothetical protein